MRKITLVFLLALAIIFAMPGAIGRLARSHHQTLIGKLANNLEGARLESSDFRDGWFTSHVTHRIVFDTPAYRELEQNLFGETGGEEPPALVVDSRIAHGPWPGTAGGPAFMMVHSSLTLSMSDGGRVDIPGKVQTRIGFTGDGQSRFASPGMTRPLPFGGGRLAWDGADVTVAFDRGAEALLSWGTIKRLALTNAAGDMVLGQVSIDGESRQTEFGIRAGHSEVRLDRFEIVAPDGSVLAGRDVTLVSDVGTAGDLVDYRFQLSATDLTGGEVTGASLAANFRASRLDAAEWGRYLDIRRRDDTAGAVDFERLLRAGPTLDIETFRITSPDGDLIAAGTVTVPADSQLKGPLTALGAARGEAALTVSPGLLARLAQSSDRLYQVAEIVLAMGYLRRDDEAYVTELRLHGGLLTINGLPLVLPR